MNPRDRPVGSDLHVQGDLDLEQLLVLLSQGGVLLVQEVDLMVFLCHVRPDNDNGDTYHLYRITLISTCSGGPGRPVVLAIPSASQLERGCSPRARVLGSSFPRTVAPDCSKDENGKGAQIHLVLISFIS